jgi:hypothetical protein
MIPWVHLVGAYLFIGTMTSGLGLLARLRWQGYEGEFFPKNPKGKIFFGIGIAIGVLFWPLVLLLIPVFRHFMRRRANRILGHCEHATPSTPFCEACGREQKKKTTALRGGSVYIEKAAAAAARKRLAEIQRRIDDAVRRRLEDPESRLPRVTGVPPVPEELKRRLQELQAAQPEAPVGFVCTRCGLPWPGFPAVVTDEQRPLCEACSKKGS